MGRSPNCSMSTAVHHEKQSQHPALAALSPSIARVCVLHPVLASLRPVWQLWVAPAWRDPSGLVAHVALSRAEVLSAPPAGRAATATGGFMVLSRPRMPPGMWDLPRRSPIATTSCSAVLHFCRPLWRRQAVSPVYCASSTQVLTQNSSLCRQLTIIACT